MIRLDALGVLAALVLMPVAGQAETIRLTPAEAEAAIAAGAAKRAAAGELAPDGRESDRGVHGEIGVAIGTGGYRAIEGYAALPLGDTGIAALGFEQSRGRGYARGYGYPCRALDTLLCRSQLDLDLATGRP